MNHGHVTPNEDGSLARCGGPGICSQCLLEKARKEGLREQLKETLETIMTVEQALSVGRSEGLMEAAKICEELSHREVDTFQPGSKAEWTWTGKLATRFREMAIEVKK